MHARLVSELTQLDERERAKGKGWNPNFLGIAFKSVQDVFDPMVASGATPEAAFSESFTPTPGTHKIARKLGLDLDVSSGRWVPKRPGARTEGVKPSGDLPSYLMGLGPGKHEITANGVPFTLYYDEQGAVGDSGSPVRGDKTGEWEVFSGHGEPLGRAVARVHVSPHGSSGYGNNAAPRYAAEQVAQAITAEMRRRKVRTEGVGGYPPSWERQEIRIGGQTYTSMQPSGDEARLVREIEALEQEGRAGDLGDLAALHEQLLTGKRAELARLIAGEGPRTEGVERFQPSRAPEGETWQQADRRINRERRKWEVAVAAKHSDPEINKLYKARRKAATEGDWGGTSYKRTSGIASLEQIENELRKRDPEGDWHFEGFNYDSMRWEVNRPGPEGVRSEGVGGGERGRVVPGSSGSFLTPPGHPDQRFAVETDLRRRPENRGMMSLSSAAREDWLNAETRAAARKALADWDKPPLDHPATQEWIAEVMGYYHNAYAAPGGEGEERYNAGNLVFDSDIDPIENADRHAGVALIRRYYPEYNPRAEEFGSSGYGQKAEATWHADVETPAALANKIRNSDLVRMTDSDVTIHRVKGENLYRNSAATVRLGDREKIAYSAEQAAGWARDPAELDFSKGASRNWRTGQDYWNGEPTDTRPGDTITYTGGGARTEGVGGGNTVDPTTGALRTPEGLTIVDNAQRALDTARDKYRRAYNRGYRLSEKGEDVRAQAILDKANAEFAAAKATFAAARGLPSVQTEGVGGAGDLSDIRAGDRITIRTPQGQERTGRVVMRSSAGGWVLNMGGAHGTPGLADERNIVKVRRGRREPDSPAGAFIRSLPPIRTEGPGRDPLGAPDEMERLDSIERLAAAWLNRPGEDRPATEVWDAAAEEIDRRIRNRIDRTLGTQESISTADMKRLLEADTALARVEERLAAIPADRLSTQNKQALAEAQHRVASIRQLCEIGST